MIDPISSSRPCGLVWEPYRVDTAPVQPKPKEETESAEEEVVSYYYLSSIQSLQASATQPIDTQTSKAAAVEAKKAAPTTFQRFTSWLRGVFGMEKAKEAEVQPAETSVAESVEQSSSSVPRSPRLQPPESMTNDRLSKSIAELNKELLYRIKDTAEFEAEMLKSNSKKMDRLILFQIVQKSLDQKKLKEIASIDAHEHVLECQDRNKDLHKKYYQILDEINATAKTNSILHWINIGTTGGIVGLLAVSFATGGLGTIVAIALPALNIAKGSLSAAEGVLKYKNDLRTGEMTMVNYEIKENRNQINDKVSTTLPFADEEISNLLKTIRHHLENYSKEARLSPQGN